MPKAVKKQVRWRVGQRTQNRQSHVTKCLRLPDTPARYAVTTLLLTYQPFCLPPSPPRGRACPPSTVLYSNSPLDLGAQTALIRPLGLAWPGQPCCPAALLRSLPPSLPAAGLLHFRTSRPLSCRHGDVTTLPSGSALGADWARRVGKFCM